MCHKRPPEVPNTDQKAKLVGEASQSSDYYNLIQEKTLSAGRLEHPQLTDDKNRLSVGIEKVKS